MKLQYVKRNNNDHSLIVGEDGKAQLAEGSMGMNGLSLVYNVCVDLGIKAPDSIASCGTVFSEEVSLDSMEIGDIIIVNDRKDGDNGDAEANLSTADVMMYMGSNRVAAVDNSGVKIIGFQQNQRKNYKGRRHPSMSGVKYSR